MIELPRAAIRGPDRAGRLQRGHRTLAFTVAGIVDLDENEITRSEVGVLFDDDCLRFELGYRRDNTRARPGGPSEGIYVRLNLATFGGSGYGQGGLR